GCVRTGRFRLVRTRGASEAQLPAQLEDPRVENRGWRQPVGAERRLNRLDGARVQRVVRVEVRLELHTLRHLENLRYLQVETADAAFEDRLRRDERHVRKRRVPGQVAAEW